MRHRTGTNGYPSRDLDLASDLSLTSDVATHSPQQSSVQSTGTDTVHVDHSLRDQDEERTAYMFSVILPILPKNFS